MARVPAGLLAGSEKRATSQERLTRKAGRDVLRQGLRDRAAAARRMRGRLAQVTLTAYRGWRKLMGKSLRVKFTRPEPDLATILVAVDRTDLEALFARGALAPARVQAISRTEGNRLNQWARERAIRDAVKADDKPRKVLAWRYTTQMDDRVRPSHRVRDGRRFQVGTRRIPLPDGVNCFPGDTVIQGRIIAGLRAAYSGVLCEITHEAGTLLVTPNHRVLACHGLISAASVVEGDDLLGQSRPRADVNPDHVHDHQEPAIAEDVFRALLERGDRFLVEAAAVDLHGDQGRVEGEIEVVSAHRELGLDDESRAPGADRLSQLDLVWGKAEGPLIPGPSGANLLVPRLGSATTSVPSGSTLAPHPSATLLDSGPLDTLCIGLAADLHAPFLQPIPQGRAAHAAFVRELLHRGAGLVAPSKVIKVEIREWTGHVYDFQSEVGWIVANDTVISNCRCYYLPVFGPA